MPETTPVKLPKSIMTASREEYYGQDADHQPIELTVKKGALPADIHGYWFIDVPVGSVGQGEEVGPGEPVFAGDGMIYQIDFSQAAEGTAILKTRLTTPPSFIADKVTTDAPKGSDLNALKFSEMGLGRLSFKLGMRNDLNTAFLPFKFANDDHYRMLVTADDGRPFEIDLETLETVTPIGYNKEWRGILGGGINIFGRPFGVMPFQLYMSTAHPVFDPDTKELFSVNYGRALGSPFAANITIDEDVTSLSQAVWEVVRHLPKLLLFYIITLPLMIVGWFRKLINNYDGNVFTYLVRWDGEGELERWELYNEDGSPVAIRQTLHQMAITKDYIVLLDAAFKFTVDQMYNSINPFHHENKFLERLARHILSGPQLPDTVMYLVPRSEINKTAGQPASQNPKKQPPSKITARKVILPPEALHFLADYDTTAGDIVLHLAHNSAACFAEWIREYDKLAYTGEAVDPDFYGMIAIGQMDISRQGKYRIDGATASLNDASVISNLDEPNTFNVGLYAYLDQSVFGQSTPKLTNIFWMGGGFYTELLTEFIFNMYKDYRYRRIPLADFERITAEGKPANLFHVETATQQIIDHYTWAGDHVGLSPQFIPRQGNTSDPTDGYIVCTVVSDVDGAEFWVFDAADLRAGPVCILGDPRIDFGVTIHTTWLPEVAPRDAAYQVNIKEDYEKEVLETRNPTIQKLFSDYIYPWYDS